MKLVCLFHLIIAVMGSTLAFAQSPASPTVQLRERLPTDTLHAFQVRLQQTLTRHRDLLLQTDDLGAVLRGKTAAGQEAFACYLLYEISGEMKYQNAALATADAIVRDMWHTPHGVLAIKEKDTPGSETIIGGGPPALGIYASRVAYILHREGGRADDLIYLGGVIDAFPWNEAGWWAATDDVTTGEPKQPLSKPSPVNKTAAMAMAAGMLGEFLHPHDPQLAARLTHKARTCVFEQIIPAQEPDGFWHYGLTGNDPKDKDVLGYFMLTANMLIDLQEFSGGYRDAELTAAIERARGFARTCIAPMTAPNNGPPCTTYATRGTPAHYSLEGDDMKRGFALARLLLGGEDPAETMRIMDAALAQFPTGNAGQDGAHAAEPTAVMLHGIGAPTVTPPASPATILD